MCYPKPGPRCSTHALKKLNAVKDKFNQVDPTDLEKINEAKHNLSLAQDEYFTSPAGIKKLREKAKETGNQKFALKADEYSAKRKAQIAEYKNFVADQSTLPVPKPSRTTTLEQDLSFEAAERKLNKQLDEEYKAQRNYDYAVQEHKAKLHELNKEFTNLERFQTPESLYNTKIDADYDYDGTRCGYDGVCSAYEGDYCRDSEYINLHVDPNSVSSSSTLASIYNCDPSYIPSELDDIGRDELDLDNPYSYDIEAEYGYYGVEGAKITLADPHGVKNRLDAYYKEKYEELSKKKAELQNNAPKPLVVAPKKTSKEKPRNTSPSSKTAIARRAAAAKREVSKVASKAPAPKRRTRSKAELSAFERDAMPLSSSRGRKAVLQEPVTKPKTRARKEWTEAEMDAFEADQRS